MKLGSNKNRICIPRVLWNAGVVCAAAASVFLVWTIVIWRQQVSRSEQLTKVQIILEQARKNLYDKQSNGIYGGKTPAETIYLYYEFLESRDFPVLSTYFVPEKRAGELNRYVGVPENEILAFVERLRAAEKKARSASTSLSSYEMKTPLYIKMKKMPNGVWEFEYLGQLGD